MTLFLLSLNLLLHSAFIWGRFAVFRIGEQFSPGAKVVQMSALACLTVDAVLIVHRNGGHLALDSLAMGLSSISGFLFLWAIRTTGLQRLSAVFSYDLPGELITSGPFRWVRNPFYLAYSLAYLQALVASRSWWAALPLGGMGAIYYRATLLEEKKFRSSRLAAEYRRYAATTGRFLPLLVPSSRSGLLQSLEHGSKWQKS